MYIVFRFIKFLAWFMAIIQSLLIIASRKHYSVDVVVAWYVNFYLGNCLKLFFSLICSLETALLLNCFFIMQVYRKLSSILC